MAMKIAILEDNEDRIAAMRACLRDKFYQYEAQFFRAAAEMIAFLQANFDNVIAISLDHDLEIQMDNGQAIDPGTGREVAEYLAQRVPACRVVIHTTNTSAAVAMEELLKEAGWKSYRVVPFDDTAWIPTDWLRAMRHAILATARLPEKKVP